MKKEDKKYFEILFVCTGNTCRSPVAEGILKKLIRDHGKVGIKVSSAGICSLENLSATPFAIQVSQKENVDLSRHRSRQLTKKLLEESGLILVMSQEHLDFIEKVDEKAASKAFLLKLFPKSRLGSNGDRDRSVLFIKDPVGGSLADYEKSFREIEKEVARILPDILKLVERNNSKASL